MVMGMSATAYAGDLDTFLFGVGTSGYEAVRAGNFQQADIDFTADYKNNPNDALAEFNMADVYHRHGQNAQADALYAQAVVNGHGYHPTALIEPHPSDATVAGAACAHLRQDGADTSVCNGGPAPI